MATPNDIYNEITRIDNAKQGIAEAIEEKGVQVPEESRIGEYPGLVRQIQTGSPDAVLYTPQELTPEQQEQARENIGAYKKPETGIPKSDLADGVQRSLEKADAALQPGALTPITELIPAQATPQNQLADKNFVNSSVATNTANYISDNGQPFQSVEDLEAYTGQLTNNDYAFVVGTDSAGNTIYTRYKYNANTQTWAAEYVLNNSSFTAEQWAAISSGITALLVQKLSELPTEVVTYVSQTLTDAQKEQARRNIGAASDGGSSQVAESALSVLAQDALEAYYTFRRTAGNAKIGNGLGRIAEVRGKSLVFNQLVQNGNFSAGTTGWIVNFGSITASNGVLSYTVTAAPETQYSERITRPIADTVIGHKYLIGFTINPSKNVKVKATLGGNAGSLDVTAGVWNRYSTIMQETSIGNYVGFWLDIDMVGEVGDVTQIKDVICIDLTLMFGAGNEPTTVAEFEALYPLPYYAYNPGVIISNKTEAVEVTGRNQWDEEWLYTTGYYDNVNGKLAWRSYGQNVFGSKSLIPVLPNTTYYFGTSAFPNISPGGSGYFSVRFADADFNFISSHQALRRSITTPENARWMSFTVGSGYGGTYNHDICINISDPSFNGQYEPYKKNTIELNIPTLTGKLNGEGDSVVIAPDGLCSAGTVYDEGVVENGYLTKIIKRIVAKEFDGDEAELWGLSSSNNPNGTTFTIQDELDAIGNSDSTNNWGLLKTTSGVVGMANNTFCFRSSTKIDVCVGSAYGGTTVEQFKAMLSANPLTFNYVLATPLVYVLDTPIPMNIEVDGGTERRTPEDTATVVNAPFYGTVQYPIAIQPKDTISNDSLTALLTALKSAGKIANYTMTWDAATNSYKFTIS